MTQGIATPACIENPREALVGHGWVGDKAVEHMITGILDEQRCDEDIQLLTRNLAMDSGVRNAVGQVERSCSRAEGSQEFCAASRAREDLGKRRGCDVCGVHWHTIWPARPGSSTTGTATTGHTHPTV